MIFSFISGIFKYFIIYYQLFIFLNSFENQYGRASVLTSRCNCTQRFRGHQFIGLVFLIRGWLNSFRSHTGISLIFRGNVVTWSKTLWCDVSSSADLTYGLDTNGKHHRAFVLQYFSVVTRIGSHFYSLFAWRLVTH